MSSLFANTQIQDGLSKLGFYSGELDGDMGANTKTSISLYAKSLGLEFSNKVEDKNVQILVDTKKLKLPRDNESEMTRYYGAKGKVETDWFDFPTRDIYLYARFLNGGELLPDRDSNGVAEHRTNAKLAPSLTAALKEIYTSHPDLFISEGWNVYDGCYMVRQSKGGSNASTHSWAAAVDFNASENPFGSKYIYDSSARTFSNATIMIMEKWGFLSGGRAWGHDYMHFQAAIPSFIRASAPYAEGLPMHIAYAY
jgi:hypothetical protein